MIRPEVYGSRLTHPLNDCLPTKNFKVEDFDPKAQLLSEVMPNG